MLIKIFLFFILAYFCLKFVGQIFMQSISRNFQEKIREFEQQNQAAQPNNSKPPGSIKVEKAPDPQSKIQDGAGEYIEFEDVS